MPQAITFNVTCQPINTLAFETLDILYNNSKPMDTWLKDAFFGDIRTLNGKDLVPVGEIKSIIPVAPAVSPKVQGRVIKSQTQANVNYVKPAYLKPAEIVEPMDDIDAQIFELLVNAGAIERPTLGQAMTPQDTWVFAAAVAYYTLRKSIDARVTLMCRDALLYGKVEVVGDDDASTEVDFGRHADLTFSPLIKWGQAGATPYQDQRAMVKRLVQHGKQGVTDAIMSSAVFESFVDDDTFNKKFKASENTNATRVFPGTFGGQVEATMRGVVDGIRYWTYDETYDVQNADGTTTEERLIPEDGFWFISESRNRLYFCKIKHRKNPQGLAYQYFPYQVSNDDPSIDKFIMDSSPLPVLVNKNGACGGTGFIEL